MGRVVHRMAKCIVSCFSRGNSHQIFSTLQEDAGSYLGAMLPTLQTGDILLLRGTSSYMNGFQRTHNTEFGHCLVVVRPPAPEDSLVLLLEVRTWAL